MSNEQNGASGTWSSDPTPDRVIKAGTTASVDARLARVEETQSQMQKTQQDMQREQVTQGTDIALVKMEQAHIREFFSLKFSSLEARFTSLEDAIKRAIVKIETSEVADATKDGALGEHLKDWATLKDRVDGNSIYIERQRGMASMVKMLVGTNVVAAIVAIVSLAKAIGLF